MWTPTLSGRNPVRYLALVEALAEAIEAGALAPGTRLPTHRDLAWRIGVNTSTVTQAYREAARRHLISGEVGRGTYVLAGSREAALFALKASVADAVMPIDLSTNVPAVDPDDSGSGATLMALAREGALGTRLSAIMRPRCCNGCDWLAPPGLPRARCTCARPTWCRAPAHKPRWQRHCSACVRQVTR